MITQWCFVKMADGDKSPKAREQVPIKLLEKSEIFHTSIHLEGSISTVMALKPLKVGMTWIN